MLRGRRREEKTTKKKKKPKRNGAQPLLAQREKTARGTRQHPGRRFTEIIPVTVDIELVPRKRGAYSFGGSGKR